MNPTLNSLIQLWLLHDTYSGHGDFNQLSATTLLKSPRYIIAQLRTTFPDKFPKELQIPISTQASLEIDPNLKIAAVLGTAVHSSFEQALSHVDPERLKQLGLPSNLMDSISLVQEKRTNKAIGDWVISGQFDLVVDGMVCDLKTTSTYSYTSGCNDTKYILQGSIYKWLNPELITQDKLSIIFVFTDFNRNYVFSKENYPKSRIQVKEFPLLSLGQTEKFIRDKINLIEKYIHSPLWEIPCCTEAELYAGKKSTWKYYKTGYQDGKRSTKNFEDYSEAVRYRLKNGNSGEIIEHKGTPFKCPCCDIQADTPVKLFKTELKIV